MTLRRLGVSPGPTGLNGPAIVSVSMCGRPVESYVPAELRRNGRNRCVFSDLAHERRTDFARPGFDGHRTRSRASTASLRSVMLAPAGRLRVVATHSDEEDALAVDGDLDLMRVLEAADGFEVGPIKLE